MILTLYRAILTVIVGPWLTLLLIGLLVHDWCRGTLRDYEKQ